MAGAPQQQAAEHSEQPQAGGRFQGVGPIDIAQVGVAARDVLLAHIVVLRVIHTFGAAALTDQSHESHGPWEDRVTSG